MMKPDLDRKAKCWSFIFTSFTDNDVRRLSNLPPSIFAYITFAVCTDDTGNRFLQGIIRSHTRCYKPTLYREIGDNAIYDIPQGGDVLYILTTIQLGQFPKEFGSATNSRFECHIKDLKELKNTVKIGITAPDQLSRRFPRICFSYPSLVMRHISEATASRRPAVSELSLDEWTNAGSPKGIPLKVYRAWRNGELHQGTDVAVAQLSTTLKDTGKGLARKVYTDWLKGEMYKA